MAYIRMYSSLLLDDSNVIIMMNFIIEGHVYVSQKPSLKCSSRDVTADYQHIPF